MAGETFVVEISRPLLGDDRIRYLRSEVLAECRSSDCFEYDSVPHVDTEIYFDSKYSKIWKEVIYVSTKTFHKVHRRKCADSNLVTSQKRECRVMNCPWGTSATPLKYGKIQSNATCVNIDNFISIEENDYDNYKPR